MASRPSHQQALLELAGRPVCALRSLQCAGYQVEPVVAPLGPGGAARLAANVRLSAFEAELDLPRPGPLLDWVLALANAQLQPMDGAGLLLDANGALRRRVLWTDGWLTQVRWPVLDAQAKAALGLGLQWQPGTLGYAPVGGERIKLPPVKAAQRLLACNFRVQGLPFGTGGGGAAVSRLALPTVSARIAAEAAGPGRLPEHHLAAVDLGELALGIAAPGRDAALAWVQQVVANGRIDDADQLTLRIELLDPSLATVLASLTLSGCMLMACEEDRFDAGAAAAGGLTLRFAPGQFGFAYM